MTWLCNASRTYLVYRADLVVEADQDAVGKSVGHAAGGLFFVCLCCAAAVAAVSSRTTDAPSTAAVATCADGLAAAAIANVAIVIIIIVGGSGSGSGCWWGGWAGRWLLLAMGDDGQNGRVVEKARKEPDVERGVLVISRTEDGKTFRYSARQIGQAIERGTVFQRLVRAV